MLSSGGALVYSPFQTSSQPLVSRRSRVCVQSDGIYSEMTQALAEQTASLQQDYPCQNLGCEVLHLSCEQDCDSGRSGTQQLGQITWSTHCSHDRFYRLQELLQRWDGPVACA